MSQPSAATVATVSALNIYPVKSCAGIPLLRARLTATGFDHDRQWLIVQANGRFVTQREAPRLALIRPAFTDGTLQLSAPDSDRFSIAIDHDGAATEVLCWRDRCKAIDAGDAAARWLERFLGQPHRLVRFDPSLPRPSDKAWTGDIEALNQFSDGFPWLLISRGSLDGLNAKLEHALPMNRFRPNIVVEGLQPFEEDSVEEFRTGAIALRPVKPCARCIITTTSQERGEREGDEPLQTLRRFRLDRKLKGVTFGQNVVLASGTGEWLEVGQQLEVRHRAS